MSRLHYRFVGLLVAVATLTSVAAGADPFFLTGPNETRRVAITFDDLPAARNSFLPELLANPKQFRTRNAKVLRQLRKLGVPVEGFVSNAFVPKTWTDDDMRQLLETWESEGALLGNHTTIHRDFHEMAIEDYFQTIRGGQEYLDKILPSAAAKGKYFRAPYLHRGKFPQDRERLEAYLNAHGYQAAPVTIDLQDWFFAEVYAWAAANHDEAKKKTVVKAYLTYLGAAIEHFALLSAVVTGRETPHVALMHASALNYDNIEQVMAQFSARDFEFIDLKTALLDPAYSKMPDSSGSWIRGWQLEKGLPWTQPPAPARFLGALYDEYQRRPQN